MGTVVGAPKGHLPNPRRGVISNHYYPSGTAPSEN